MGRAVPLPYNCLNLAQVYISPYSSGETAHNTQQNDGTAEPSEDTDLDEMAIAKQQALEAMRTLRADHRSGDSPER